MYPRLLKTSITLMQVAFLWLSYRILTGQLDSMVASAALVVSGFWLGLTALRLRSLLRTYFDHLSRLQILVPTVVGTLLAGLAIFAGKSTVFTALAAAELLGWLLVYIDYRRNRANYIIQGHGPMPKDAWVNPDAAALQPGDLILTSGRMAARLHDTVGHAELVIRSDDGRLHAFSAYMENGAVIHRLEAVTSKLRSHNVHYIALRLRKPLSEKQLCKAPAVALRLLALNAAWRDKTNHRRERLINSLPLPKSMKQWLVKKTHASGYDWAGLYIGTRAHDRWTCIAICLELLKTIGVPVGNYGTGLLGLGTGLFDPIMPVRLLGDKAYRLVDVNDRAAFEAASR